MTVVAIAALSARMLAESAVDDGYEVVALDLFGDADTRRAARQWACIGDPATWRIDPAMCLDALDAVARRGDAIGWIAGAGFEGDPDLLARGAAVLPLIGNDAATVAALRSPSAFFGLLDNAGIPHPEVRTVPPAGPGWLRKEPGGCGGWHIERVDAAPAPTGLGATKPAADAAYWQREVPGTPMSLTFVANGRRAHVLGCNELVVRPLAGRPFIYHGAIGPVPIAASLARRLGAALDVVVAHFGLRGGGSFDFLLDGDRFQVLEANPRPSATVELYGSRLPGTRAADAALRRRHRPIAAHVEACLDGTLPTAPWPAAGPSQTALDPAAAAADAVGGSLYVYLPAARVLDEATRRRLEQRDDCHDVPAAGARFDAGEPLCSVAAIGAEASQVRARLARAEADILALLEDSR